MSLTIHVTIEDIAKATEIGKGHTRPARSKWCPISQALHRLGYPEAYTGANYLYLDKRATTPIPLPPQARRLVSQFDNYDKETPDPITFEIEV